MELTRQQKADFLETLWAFYARSGRGSLPWRQAESDGSFDPYKIMVSELMLQQTQVARVIPKYFAFLERFPTVQKLAAAELGDVLRTWQGLGYNRRAKFLWQAAQTVAVRDRFPDTLEELVKLPGVGINTAGAILAYACNQPVVFIETNIRTVYIHHFFADRSDVTDKEILEVIRQTLPWGEGKEQPDEAIYSLPGAMRKTVGLSHYREFYWALMDYGSHLKATVGNLRKASKHYAKQSVFHGSRRQLRGQILRVLGAEKLPLTALQAVITDDRLEAVLAELVRENLVHRTDDGAYAL